MTIHPVWVTQCFQILGGSHTPAISKGKSTGEAIISKGLGGNNSMAYARASLGSGMSRGVTREVEDFKVWGQYRLYLEPGHQLLQFSGHFG